MYTVSESVFANSHIYLSPHFTGGVELSGADPLCLRADTMYTASVSVPESEPLGGFLLLDSVSLLVRHVNFSLLDNIYCC